MRSPRLYTYCIPIDDGAAPNPFWGTCTLNICKPAIRRTAEIGDWVVGTGSVQDGFENKVIYAMKVTDKMRMEEYDEWASSSCPNKIPKRHSTDWRLRLGDCIYDFSSSPPTIRNGVHIEGNRERDLGGVSTLLSTHFYYFGDEPVALPEHLLPIVRQGQSHRVHLNAPHFDSLLNWIQGLAYPLNSVLGKPAHQAFGESGYSIASACRAKCHAEDEAASCD